MLISVDEIHSSDGREDMRELGTVIQHLFREERPVVLGAAGLPSAINDLLTDNVLTFMRRADRQHLGTGDPADVSDALQRPINQADRQIDPEALEHALIGTRGYPFFIQLIGHWVWSAQPNQPSIDLVQATEGALAARRRMGSLVHEPALYDLSPIDRTFLAAWRRTTGTYGCRRSRPGLVSVRTTLRRTDSGSSAQT